MDADYHLDFIDVIDLEKEFEIYETLTSKELIVILRTYNHHRKLHDEGLKNNASFIYYTCEQEKQGRKLSEWLHDNYPNNINNEKKDQENKQIRKKQLGKFGIICRKNNKAYFTDDVLKRINDMIKSKNTFDKKKYDNEEIMCDCGCFSLRKNLSRHKTSKLHFKKLEELNRFIKENNGGEIEESN